MSKDDKNGSGQDGQRVVSLRLCNRSKDMDDLIYEVCYCFHLIPITKHILTEL